VFVVSTSVSGQYCGCAVVADLLLQFDGVVVVGGVVVVVVVVVVLYCFLLEDSRHLAERTGLK
jgi:hypothetical protein